MTPQAMLMVAIGENCKSRWLGLDGVDATSIHMLDVCACACLPFFMYGATSQGNFSRVICRMLLLGVIGVNCNIEWLCRSTCC